MSNYVLVLDTQRQPLAPCQPARARELLNKGKASVFRRYPFTIILNYIPEGPIKSDFDLRLDPGSKTTGIAVVGQGKRGERCVIGINLHHRGEWIKKKLQDRAVCRRSRRSRNTRYRPMRFLNRTRPKGWLPPSVNHRVATTRTWIDRLMRWCPITTARVELVSFDTQKLMDPDISSKAYQQGRLYNTEMREYLLTAHQHTCQYCKGTSGNNKLQWEHKVPKSRGGSNALSNATLACRRCNELKDNLTPMEWLAKIQHRKGPYYDTLKNNIPTILKNQSPSLRDAAVMNAIRYRHHDYLADLGLNPVFYPGWKTKRNRLDQRYRKDHWIDAACVGGIGSRTYISLNQRCLSVRSTGHGSRKMCLPDKYGFPRTKAKGPSRVMGYKTGDIVTANIPKGKFKGRHVGRISVRMSGQFSINQHNVSVHYISKIYNSDGYGYYHGESETIGINMFKEDRLSKKVFNYCRVKQKVVKANITSYIVETYPTNLISCFPISSKH